MNATVSKHPTGPPMVALTKKKLFHCQSSECGILSCGMFIKKNMLAGFIPFGWVEPHIWDPIHPRRRRWDGDSQESHLHERGTGTQQKSHDNLDSFRKAWVITGFFFISVKAGGNWRCISFYECRGLFLARTVVGGAFGPMWYLVTSTLAVTNTRFLKYCKTAYFLSGNILRIWQSHTN